MNPVLILTHNCLELTKKCVESVLAQDVPVELLVYDNASTDGTSQWLPDNTAGSRFMAWRSCVNSGVSAGWNWGLSYLFRMGAPHVLVTNNDTILAPWTYRMLLAYDAPFVTGVSFEKMDEVMKEREPSPLTPGPDFSCFLIRRDAWDKVGPFDERMVHYYSDNDWHVRAHRAGVPLMNSHVKFYHERSSTLKRSAPAVQAAIQLQADRDRQVFYDTYGCHTWTPDYQDLFK